MLRTLVFAIAFSLLTLGCSERYGGSIYPVPQLRQNAQSRTPVKMTLSTISRRNTGILCLLKSLKKSTASRVTSFSYESKAMMAISGTRLHTTG